MTKKRNIAVIGAGAWGTALGIKMAQTSDSAVSLWAFEARTAETINKTKENKDFLPSVPLPSNLTATTDFTHDAQLIFLAAPTQHIRALVPQFKLPPNAPIIICSKGIETSTGKLISEVLAEFLPNPIAVLTGPSFAKETALNQPTALTLACADPALGQKIKEICQQPNFQLDLCPDIIGAQLGGAVKNTIAIACGIALGAGFGENARATLISRGLDESALLAEKMGGQRITLLQLAGVGDMVLTASSQTSRNTSLGFEIGQGGRLADILSQRTSVAEGVATAASLAKLAKKHKIALPLSCAVHDILSEKISPADAAPHLLGLIS